jgi:hypothetical protein
LFETKPLKTWADEVDEADGTLLCCLPAGCVLDMGLKAMHQCSSCASSVCCVLDKQGHTHTHTHCAWSMHGMHGSIYGFLIH